MSEISNLFGLEDKLTAMEGLMAKPDKCKLCPFNKIGKGFVGDDETYYPITLVRLSPNRDEVETRLALPSGTSFGNWARDLLEITANKAGIAKEELWDYLKVVYLHKCYIPSEEKEVVRGRAVRVVKKAPPSTNFCFPTYFKRQFDVQIFTYDFNDIVVTPAYTDLMQAGVVKAIRLYNDNKDKYKGLRIGVLMGGAVLDYYYPKMEGGLKTWQGHWFVNNESMKLDG